MPDMTGSLTIGVDVGGTKIAAAVVDEFGKLIEHLRRDTPGEDAAATERTIVDLVHELRSRHQVTGVGIGVAGFISADQATVIFAPNLAFRDEPLRHVIQEQVGLPVVVENDGNAAAWGEFRFGSGKDVNDLLLVTVGTGVGGGVVLRGEIIRGTFGIAAEIGHMRVVPRGRLCGCGRHGCWEQYASGRALVADARRLVLVSDDAGPLLAAAEHDLDKITGLLITRLAHEGDRLCVELLAQLGRWLGEGIVNLVEILDPGVVLVGGGVSDAGDLVMKPLQAAFLDGVPAAEYRPLPEIRLASMGNEAGLIGAADLARQTT
jgi:glucokinase